VGAGIPLAASAVSGAAQRIGAIFAVAVVSLLGLGYLGARLGGAAPTRPVGRVVVGGLIAMGATMLVGKLFGAAVT
jgi:VIT1/CCC1 family predicted Fe2+/Mn2+ transporter